LKGNARACKENIVDACIVYELVGYISIDRQFVVRVSEYESGFVLLVGRESGNGNELEDWPRLSPSGKRFVAVAASDAWDVKNAIVIFSTVTDPPTFEWRFPTPTEYEQYSFDGWDGEDRVKLRVISKDNMETEVSRTAEGWRLRRPNGDLSPGLTSLPPPAGPAKPNSETARP
jgi:hypothetical protein